MWTMTPEVKDLWNPYTGSVIYISFINIQEAVGGVQTDSLTNLTLKTTNMMTPNSYLEVEDKGGGVNDPSYIPPNIQDRRLQK